MKSGKDFDPIETREWIESLDDVIDDQGTDRASFLLNELAKHLMDKGAVPSYNLTTSFNDISSKPAILLKRSFDFSLKLGSISLVKISITVSL